MDNVVCVAPEKSAWDCVVVSDVPTRSVSVDGARCVPLLLVVPDVSLSSPIVEVAIVGMVLSPNDPTVVSGGVLVVVGSVNLEPSFWFANVVIVGLVVLPNSSALSLGITVVSSVVVISVVGLDSVVGIDAAGGFDALRVIAATEAVVSKFVLPLAELSVLVVRCVDTSAATVESIS